MLVCDLKSLAYLWLKPKWPEDRAVSDKVCRGKLMRTFRTDLWCWDKVCSHTPLHFCLLTHHPERTPCFLPAAGELRVEEDCCKCQHLLKWLKTSRFFMTAHQIGGVTSDPGLIALHHEQPSQWWTKRICPVKIIHYIYFGRCWNSAACQVTCMCGKQRQSILRAAIASVWSVSVISRSRWSQGPDLGPKLSPGVV